MTPSRQILTAFAAMVAAVSFGTDTACAGGISVHTTGQQLKADVELLVPAFTHFEVGIKQWAKDNPGASDLAGTRPIATRMVKTISNVGHRFRTQRWPAQDMVDVRSLEQATTALGVDMAQYPGLNVRDVNSWGATFQKDLKTFGNAGQALSADLGVN
jgi:hypothetical protein